MRRLSTGLVAALVLLVALVVRAHALTLESQSAEFDPATNLVHFTLVLSGPPDLFTYDSFGRQKDSFQYHVVYDPARLSRALFDMDVVIRAAEIPWNGNVLAVRDRFPYSDGSDHSGGWGPVRGTVPYTLTGSTITFTVPLALLGDSDGTFGYYLMVLQWGGTESAVYALVPGGTVPTAPTTWGRVKTLFR